MLSTNCRVDRQERLEIQSTKWELTLKRTNCELRKSREYRQVGAPNKADLVMLMWENTFYDFNTTSTNYTYTVHRNVLLYFLRFLEKEIIRTHRVPLKGPDLWVPMATIVRYHCIHVCFHQYFHTIHTKLIRILISLSYVEG